MASHIPLVEEDHVIGLDGKPLAPLPVNAWAGLPFEIHPHMRKGEVAHRYNPHPLLLVHVRSHGRSRIRSGQTVFDLALAPGQVDVFCAGFHMDHGCVGLHAGRGAWRSRSTPSARAASCTTTRRAIDPTTRLSVRDPVLERLFACMRSEVDTGCASGRLFAEGLSLSLLARLAACYGSARRQAGPAGAQALVAQLQQTVEFIEAHIGADLSVATLASQLGMSPYTFAKLFKAKVESSPHSFVLSRRIQRAELLLGGALSLSEIALSVGFASQSHFTEAFRRRTGRTPSKARRREPTRRRLRCAGYLQV